MIDTDCISYQKSGYFSKLIVDYLDEKPHLKPFYNRFPRIEKFPQQIEEKKSNYNDVSRAILVDALKNQYKNFSLTEVSSNNIESLKNNNTYTITTGHQLNLFTGPIFFFYKIINTINLCIQLKGKYSEYNFVPIFWMATEDHDFEEINHFHFKSKKISWEKNSKSPVGRLNTSDLKEVFEKISSELGNGINANYLKKLFEKSYLNHSTLSDATRFLVNELFGDKGLVILDGDDFELKKLSIPYLEKELLHQTSFNKITETNSQLKEYTVQVNPREINLFYIEDNLRERIVFENNIFKVINTKLKFTKDKILEELHKNPQKFSPNVVLRPLYQEVILPNLCYIGGGGEIAYWLQLKSNFEANSITFPILLLRNSALLVNQKQFYKKNKLNLNWEELFLNQNDLTQLKIKEFSKFEIDFTKQKEYLKKQFEELKDMANQTDKSFIGAVKAQEVKQIKGLENLEKRLLKAEKRVYTDALEKIVLLQTELFPNQSLQERKVNFAEFYIDYGKDFIERLFAELQPLDKNFKIINI